MIETKQTENGVELHEFAYTPTGMLKTYPDTLVLSRWDDAGNEYNYIFTALDDKAANELKMILECKDENGSIAEVYKLSKVAYKAVLKEYTDAIKYCNLYSDAIGELEDLKDDSEYTKALDPDE